jgi:hypothetical protein
MELPTSMSAYTPSRVSDAPICALDFEDIVAHTVDVLGTSLDERVWEGLHHPDLFGLDVPVLFVVVAKDGCPRDLPVGHLRSKLCEDRLGVPRGSLAIELIAGEDDQVGMFHVEDVSQQGIREVIRGDARIEHRVQANTAGHRKVQISNLKNFEPAVV